MSRTELTRKLPLGNNESEIFNTVDSRIVARVSRCPTERERSMTDEVVNRNTTAALIAGTLLGAGIALLFAPQSGRKTRRDIRQLAEKVGTKAEAARLELQHFIDSIIGDVEEKLREGLACGMDWTDSKIVDLRRALEEARNAIAGDIEKIQSKQDAVST
jgi:gas vesicle protein